MIKFVACAGILFALCIAEERENGQDSGLTGDVVMAHGSTLGGTHSVESFHIPANAVVQVTGDLRIVSRTRIVVDGVLFAVNGTQERPAPRIVLVAEDTVCVNGVIIGGRGENYGTPDTKKDVGVQGGAGTNIDLVGRYVTVYNGYLAAGNGGSAGRGGQGGTGGNLLVYGKLPPPDHWSCITSTPTLVSGTSGKAGQGIWEFNNGKGGRGGKGGKVSHYSRADYPTDR